MAFILAAASNRAIDYQLLAAVIIGWIITVVLHEFAHGLVAYLGGDYTIRERGGLTLNPLQYVDPMMSLIFPAIMLLMGGIPLPGGATYVRRDLLRNRFWQSAVSLAGPLTNLALFFACALPLHPAFGWLEAGRPPAAWTTPQLFLGAMAILQLAATVLNLVPVPPLDGFQALAPFLPDRLRIRLSTPPISTWAFFGYFVALWFGGIFGRVLIHGFPPLMRLLGYGPMEIWAFFIAYFRTFHGITGA